MNREPKEVLTADYDLVFVTCGYEERASHILTRYTGNAEHLIALDYACAGVHSYDKNRALIDQRASHWINLRSLDVATQIAESVKNGLATIEGGSAARVLVDVSSCSRSVLANLLLALAEPRNCSVVLTCAYAISDFYDPPVGELPSSISEPVIGDLSGWSHDLSKPPCAIIGLGFEPGRALGSIDYLEVPEVRLFLPQGPDQRFEAAVLAANKLLTDEVGSPLRYNILDPEDAFQKLTSLVYGVLPRFRPIIIPLGPKIFAALSMLLALRLFPQVCIWRTSAGSGEEVADRKPSGIVVAFEYAMPLLEPVPDHRLEIEIEAAPSSSSIAFLDHASALDEAE